MKYALIALLVVVHPPPARAAPPAQAQQAPILSLDMAIKRAVLANRTLEAARIALRAAKNVYEDAWEKMFLPSVNLAIASTSAHTLTRLPGSAADALGGDAVRARGYPTTAAALSVGSYALFNFWKDRITYDIARLTHEREKQRVDELERALRFQVTAAYFRLKTDQEKLEAAARSVQIAEALADLVKSRKAVGKATENDVSSAVVDLLSAKNQYVETAKSIKSDHWDLNLLLADPIDTPYRLNTPLKYVPLRMTAEEALKAYLETGPNLREARLSLKTTDLNVELAEKNRLPLPTLSTSGVTFTYQNSYYGTRNVPGSTGTTSGNIEISTSISLTLPLLGPGGLLNGRDVERARLARDQSEVNYQQIGSQDQKNFNVLIASIKQQETTIANLRETFEYTASLLERLFSNAARGVPRLELRDALLQARQSELTLKDSLLGHLTTKLSLAQTIGVDQLPGDSLR